MKDWNYAQLSRSAKQMGGPEKMVETITSNARTNGRMDMLPWIGLAMVVGYGAKLIVEKVKGRIERRKEEARKAEEELIQAMERERLKDNEMTETTGWEERATNDE